MAGPRQMTVTPSAARLTGSLRDIGYTFPAAVADLVDNSIAAGARHIEIDLSFAGAESRVTVADDGQGMTANGVVEALRFGSRRDYVRGDLGRYGLGLKTASLSQCRVVTVGSRRPESGRTSVRQLDLDLIEDWDEWLVVDPGRSAAASLVREILGRGFSTVVAWDRLDRVLPGKADGAWARRRFDTLVARTRDHLAMVFHRFLEGRAQEQIVIAVNGVKVRPWDPFALAEPATVALPEQEFELTVGEVTGAVTLARHILPSRDSFSSPAESERLAGPLKWNRQQGLYIYRAGRLVQWGGWAGIRAIDEHTKLARVALSFDTDLDPVFNINVAKIRVTVPPQLRQMLERPINELCIQASDAYRKTSGRARGNLPAHGAPERSAGAAASTGPPSTTVGLALRSAAIQVGEYDALKRIAALLNEQTPDVAAALGLERL